MNDRVQSAGFALASAACLFVCVAACHADPPSFSVAETKVEWCEADENIAIANVQIRIKFMNNGTTKMILSRMIVPQLDLRVYGPNGESVTPINEHGLAYGQLGDTPDAKRFEILAPGESGLRTLVVKFFVSRDPNHPAHSVPIAGDYRISATLSTWPFWNDVERAVRTKRLWEQYGRLVTEDAPINLSKVGIYPPINMTSCEARSNSSAP